MYENLIGSINCELCGGILILDEGATVDDYSIVVSANIDNLFDKVENIIGKYLVYKCTICGAIYKYTYKDFEKALRKKMTERLLFSIAHGFIKNNIVLSDSYLYYCGKCSGFDGTGCCPKSIYDKCIIKRFPINGL